MAITYNAAGTQVVPTHIYRATSGGTVFSANLTGSTTMDLFTDTFVVNDALYFRKGSTTINTMASSAFSDVIINIGTAMAATSYTLVWEYYKGTPVNAWSAIERFVDNTANLTTSGTFQFPYQQDWQITTVNAINTNWIRCRVSAVSTPTEGGAVGAAIKVNDGIIYVTGYTTPACTFTDIYNYMNTNYPYVQCQHVGNYFDFRWVALQLLSATTTTKEVIEFGFNMNILSATGIRGYTVLDYLTSGTKVGDYNGCNGSTFIINGVNNEYLFSFGSNQKSYDTAYLGRPNGQAGYPALAGEFLDCNLELSPGSPTASGILYNNRIQIGLGIIAGSWAGTFINNRLMVSGSAAISSYQAALSFTGLDVKFTSTTSKYVIGIQQTCTNVDFDFIDPTTPLPSSTDAWTLNQPIYRSRGTYTGNPNVFLYDASADTYTDITTASNNATVNDVPVYGDVDDCIYINIGAANTELKYPAITSTIGGTNDYVYALEYYYSGSWRTPVKQWDESANFTKTGTWWYQRVFSALSALTVNGVSAYWVRFRIVTKGTGTPSIDKLQFSASAGISDWNMYEKYNINYTAKDDTEALLEGVTTTYTDKWGTVQFTGTTSALGVITAAPVKNRRWYFDPLDATKNVTTDVVEQLYNPYVKKSRKYGYVPTQLSVTVALPQYPVDVMATDIYVTADETTAAAYTGITIDGSANTVTVSEDHTIQEVYDYCQDWAADNLAYAVPLNATSTTGFNSPYEWIISADLTGTGILDLGSNDLTLSGTSTLDIIASDGTHTNIKLTGLVDGSRVQLYNDTTDTELYNDVTGTTLTFPSIWTGDETMRIRVMFVDGVTAKSWYEATGTFANTGLTLNVAQTDDDVYNAIGIDGSTVTECSITGATLVIDIDDPDNTTTAQRLYAFEVAWLFTEDGMRDQELYIDATDATHFTFSGGLKIKNSDTVNPLELTGGNIVPSTGAATAVLDTSGGSIFLNFNRVEGFPYMTEGGLTVDEHDKLYGIDTKIGVIDTNVDSIPTDVAAVTTGNVSGEIATIPVAATATMEDKINFIFTYFKNKRIMNQTHDTLYAADGSTPIGAAPMTKTSSEVTKGDMV